VCADEHVILPLGLASSDMFNVNFNILLFPPMCLSPSPLVPSPRPHPSCSSCCPHRPPLSSTDRSLPSTSQSRFARRTAICMAEDPQITHIISADVKTQSRHWPTLHMLRAALADCPSVWTPQDLDGFLGCI